MSPAAGGVLVESWAMVAPVLPGKREDLFELADHLAYNPEELRESRRNAGITMERAYLQPTPAGDVVVTCYEGFHGPGRAREAIAFSGLKIDAWYLERVNEVHGLDLAKPPAGTSSRRILHDADASAPRKNGLAFCAPLLPGKREVLERTIVDVHGPRHAEMAESRRAKGITREDAYLNVTPSGDIVCAYLEGDDPIEGTVTFAKSDAPFDLWFKEKMAEALGIRFDKPLPPIVQVLDYVDWARPLERGI